MENIHILQTDKPSRLAYDFDKLVLNSRLLSPILYKTQNIYIISDEEINQQTKPCWCINTIKNTWDADLIYYQGSMPQYHYVGFKKIILTTDQDLIKDGVQAIDDEFLEWFVKNPSCEYVEVKSKVTKDGVWTDLKGYVELPTIHSISYKIIIPKEEQCNCTNKCIDKDSNNCKGIKQTCIQCDGTGETTSSQTYNSQRKCDLCDGKGYWNREIIPKEEPKQDALNHFSSTSSVIVKDPQISNFNKQETLEKAGEKYTSKFNRLTKKEIFEEGAKWQMERSYSEEEVIELLQKALIHQDDGETGSLVTAQGKIRMANFYSWFEQFKKK